MNDNRSRLKALIHRLNPVYLIFYYVENGEIKIFSGGKHYPETEEDSQLGSFIVPCFKHEVYPTNEEVIAAFEKRERLTKGGSS